MAAGTELQSLTKLLDLGSADTKPAPVMGASALPARWEQPSTAGKALDSPAEMLAVCVWTYPF